MRAECQRGMLCAASEATMLPLLLHPHIAPSTDTSTKLWQ
jgi:hypothetical protein